MNTDFYSSQDFLNLLSGLLTPMIAVIAAWIAYQQMKNNGYKVRIDLFERRMRIFESFRNSLVIIQRDASSREIDWQEYNFMLRQASFLLNDKLVKYLNEIDRRIHEMGISEYYLQGAGSLPVGEERSKVARENSEHLTWLINQFEPLEEKFSNFMKMNKI
jgi:hypothetical protein